MKTKITPDVSNSASPVAEKLLMASRMEADKLLIKYKTTLNGYSEEDQRAQK